MSKLSKEFTEKCKKFFEVNHETRDKLQSCIEENVNSDVNKRCKTLKSDYLFAISQTFCLPEYEAGVKCQKAAGDEWASRCFNENTVVGQCLEVTLKKLYRYGLENHTKNPNALPKKAEK
ncbi:lysosomal protein NCU-G1 [Perkinsela sp. CCAP 1560/4]|nr:lysosomal protein NCU-G1 [Perkinsela sp. CCAP 1560/4]|eukprot:KNH04366.1 lysosomal protein NCU-G1 [Perkinsela sp. CCAP 1560/4]